jgi:hypothetical protein
VLLLQKETSSTGKKYYDEHLALSKKRKTLVPGDVIFLGQATRSPMLFSTFSIRTRKIIIRDFLVQRYELPKDMVFDHDTKPFRLLNIYNCLLTAWHEAHTVEPLGEATTLIQIACRNTA